MARAATAGELVKFRGDGQTSELYLAVHTPAAVFACRLNGAPEVNDRVASLTYDGVTTGAYTDVLPGMTCYVGSSAGAYDKGMVRIRKAATDTVLYIGETSEINFADNDYLTVVDEFNLWAKHLTLTGGVAKMDYDIAYSDQHANPDPVPVLGPDAVLWLPSGGTATFSPSAASSWVLGGSITAYQWAAPSATAITNDTTAAPTVSYGTAGTYRVGCTVTASNGSTMTGYRNVFVYSAASMPLQVFQLESCAGDWETGGWGFSVVAYDEATRATVRDRAKCILFAREWYGGAAGSIGPISGYENIVCTGWIVGESIEHDTEQGLVRFTVRGPQYWLDRMVGFATGVKDINGSDPTSWIRYRDLDVAAGAWHFLHWRSTATACMDVTLTGLSTNVSATEAAIGSLWQQLDAITYQTMLAKPLCDRYGRLFIEVDPQMELAENRAYPVVMDVTTADWRKGEKVQIERRTVPEVGLLELSGVMWTGTAASAIFSKAPGRVMKAYGRGEVRDRLAVSSQSGANYTAGYLLAWLNNEYPNVVIPLPNNRLVDICPGQHLSMTLAAGDTERGIVWSAKLLVPRRVEYVHEAGALLVTVECEAETTGIPGVSYYPPATPTQNIPTVPGVPELPGYPLIPGGGTWFPPTYTDPPATGETCTTDMSAPANAVGLSFDDNHILGGESTTAACHCYVRSSSATNKTYLTILPNATVDRDTYVVTAVDQNGDDILTASYTGFTPNNGASIYEFSPASATEVWGFKITCPGSDGFATYDLSGVFDSGNANSTQSTGAEITGLTVGNWYAIESGGGPTTIPLPPDMTDKNVYEFALSNNDGVSWSGAYGMAYRDAEPYGYVFLATVPSFAEFGVRVGVNYGRVYWQATTEAIRFRHTQAGRTNVAGSLGYVVYTVTYMPAGEYWINIDQPYMHNICAA